MTIRYKPDHAVVRTSGGMTYIYFPFDTKEPNRCPVHVYDGMTRIDTGFSSFREYETTRPANADPNSLALYNAIPHRKNKRLNREGVEAIKFGYTRPTGDNKETK